MNSPTQYAIGVFDSGMGGLTVLRALNEKLPRESFIYLGDTARLPYGTKSPDTVRHYAVRLVKILIERKIKALVIACNTATTAALPHLQNLFPDLPIIGVVQPGAEAAVAVTQNQHIAVFATETTIASHAYQNIITQQLPQASISARACSLLVALAEEGMTANILAKEALRHYLSEFSSEDTLLLGCTHFPVFKPLLQQLLPMHVQIVDSAAATANALARVLQERNLLNESSLSARTIQYLVTDSKERFRSIGEIFLGEQLDVASIDII